jgi:acetoin utilization protein AcuC
MNLHIAYGDEYLDWQLGKNHPTNPERATLAVNLLKDDLGSEAIEIVEPTILAGDVARLCEVHNPSYVVEVLFDGYSGEWIDSSQKLGRTALSMFAGTARLTELMLAGETKVAFNPQGAKHHAQYSYSSGFCVFNDMAWSALEFQKHGLTPLYIDWDAHHGDGVENLLLDSDIATASIHDSTAFPGTGQSTDEKLKAFNWALPRNSGDEKFAQAMDEIAVLADQIKPDVILLATGADAHQTDPLSSLNFTYEGYAYASEVVSNIALKHAGGRVLIGGAGGYQPHTHTPQIWAQVVADIYQRVAVAKVQEKA